MSRRARACVAALAVVLLPVLLGAASADARPTLTCKAADLRYPYMPGGPRTFGVFALRITGGTCATAHRVAQAWMTRFEHDLRAGRVRLPRSVEGFRFTTLPANAAQTYRERGRRQTTSIRFDYRVPNG